MLRFKLLGTSELSREDGTSVRSVLAQPKRLALLAYLTLEARGRPVRRNTLLALFWPERDEAHARNALRQSLYFLRRSLGDGVVESEGDGTAGALGSCPAGQHELVQEFFRNQSWSKTVAGKVLDIRRAWTWSVKWAWPIVFALFVFRTFVSGALRRPALLNPSRCSFSASLGGVGTSGSGVLVGQGAAEAWR